MLKKRMPVVLAAAAALLLTSAPAASAAPPASVQPQLKVASYNLYLGGNIEPLLSAGSGLSAAAAQLWTEVAQSNFPARAVAIAELIAKDAPDVVGLQEVALWQVSSTATGAPLGTLDYLQTLLTALNEQGAPYRDVAVTTNFASPPVPLGNGTSVAYTDHDVILVRDDLPTSQLSVVATNHGTFTEGVPFTIPIPVPPYSMGLKVIRGWASADLLVHGTTYRFVNTHLEAFDSAPYGAYFRNAQASQLMTILAASPLPVVLVGDLNDDPLQGGGALEILSNGLGLADSWTQPAKRGFTSGQDLTARTAEFDRRIDFVLYEADRAQSPTAMHTHLIGEVPADRTRTSPPLWPSDHAGVVTTLRLPR